MDEQKEEYDEELLRFHGCGTGCCMGAVGAPILFWLFLEILFRLSGDFDAEGVPFFLIMSVPVGAIAGAVLYPFAQTLLRLIINKINSRVNPPTNVSQMVFPLMVVS